MNMKLIIQFALLIAFVSYLPAQVRSSAFMPYGMPPLCSDSSNSPTAQTCNTTQLFTPQMGDCIIYMTTTTNTGDLTTNVNTLGAVHWKKWMGSTTLAAGDMAANGMTIGCYDGTYWECLECGSTQSLAGMIFLVTSGTCPAWATQVTSLNGYTLQGTLSANGDVGTTGGSNSITPTGTISATFTGTAGTIPAETFTGSALATHTHTVTPTGTNASQSITSASTEVPVTSPTKYVFSTLNSAAAASSSPSITIPAEVFTGSQDTTSAVSAGTPSGTNSTASYTPAGTISGTFAGTAFDPHPAFMKVIFCSHN